MMRAEWTFSQRKIKWGAWSIWYHSIEDRIPNEEKIGSQTIKFVSRQTWKVIRLYYICIVRCKAGHESRRTKSLEEYRSSCTPDRNITSTHVTRINKCTCRACEARRGKYGGPRILCSVQRRVPPSRSGKISGHDGAIDFSVPTSLRHATRGQSDPHAQSAAGWLFAGWRAGFMLPLLTFCCAAWWRCRQPRSWRSLCTSRLFQRVHPKGACIALFGREVPGSPGEKDIRNGGSERASEAAWVGSTAVKSLEFHLLLDISPTWISNPLLVRGFRHEHQVVRLATAEHHQTAVVFMELRFWA